MTGDLKKAISEKVLAARVHQRLTQEQMSEVIGRSVEAVSNIERGLSLPTLETLDRVATAASLPISFFFEGLGGDEAKGRNADAASTLRLLLTKISDRDAALLVALARSMAEAP